MQKSTKRIATMHKMQVTGLEMFYKNGYYSTSVDDILKELNLSKGAFYYHFKSKEEFFISILQSLVVKKVYSMLIEPIEGHDNPIDLITNCLEDALQTAEHNEYDYGFVLQNFITEFNGSNPEIMKYLNDTLKIWEVNLVSTLQRGKFNGYVDRHIDCEGVASYIISSFLGIRTLMVEGSATALRYRYMQQIRFYLRAMANKQTA
ncbi:TetR/AcrR family transcriptional regulator [Cellulophaga baltica]|uniref:TetR/AcrR family transcriptional regulator n=1 Tax=Cellulophaga TaxID=104264 RepID=UPI001C066729|nr:MULTISPECIES: TetR/AcrR family transcriptional regulator [Cellulophaga]MBU2995961.1 TetR/AcrR family transcriptional regulator [Cellulophaga baltica]MDO6767356.1 TetR/AcrR family transcriptional regulator [Cellulophaga sp. 1_MG-2023]